MAGELMFLCVLAGLSPASPGHFICLGVIPALMVPMNCNRGGSFQDESFATARAAALRAFREIYGPDSPEFLEFSEHFRFDWGITGDLNAQHLHARFLETAMQAIRPQDKVTKLQP